MSNFTPRNGYKNKYKNQNQNRPPEHEQQTKQSELNGQHHGETPGYYQQPPQNWRITQALALAQQNYFHSSDFQFTSEQGTKQDFNGYVGNSVNTQCAPAHMPDYMLPVPTNGPMTFPCQQKQIWQQNALNSSYVTSQSQFFLPETQQFPYPTMVFGDFTPVAVTRKDGCIDGFFVDQEWIPTVNRTKESVQMQLVDILSREEKKIAKALATQKECKECLRMVINGQIPVNLPVYEDLRVEVEPGENGELALDPIGDSDVLEENGANGNLQVEMGPDNNEHEIAPPIQNVDSPANILEPDVQDIGVDLQRLQLEQLEVAPEIHEDLLMQKQEIDGDLEVGKSEELDATELLAAPNSMDDPNLVEAWNTAKNLPHHTSSKPPKNSSKGKLFGKAARNSMNGNFKKKKNKQQKRRGNAKEVRVVPLVTPNDFQQDVEEPEPEVNPDAVINAVLGEILDNVSKLAFKEDQRSLDEENFQDNTLSLLPIELADNESLEEENQPKDDKSSTSQQKRKTTSKKQKQKKKKIKKGPAQPPKPKSPEQIDDQEEVENEAEDAERAMKRNIKVRYIYYLKSMVPLRRKDNPEEIPAKLASVFKEIIVWLQNNKKRNNVAHCHKYINRMLLKGYDCKQLRYLLFLMAELIENPQYRTVIVEDITYLEPRNMNTFSEYFNVMTCHITVALIRDMNKYLIRQAMQRLIPTYVPQEDVSDIEREILEAAKASDQVHFPLFHTTPYFISRKETHAKNKKKSAESNILWIIYGILGNFRKQQTASVLNFDFHYISQLEDETMEKKYIQVLSGINFEELL